LALLWIQVLIYALSKAAGVDLGHCVSKHQKHDPTCYEDSTIETLNVSQITNLNKMQECIMNISDSNPFDFNEVDSDKLWAYCMLIKSKSGSEVSLFKKFSAAKVMRNKIPLFSNGRTIVIHSALGGVYPETRPRSYP
jgi:hypothetical protein